MMLVHLDTSFVIRALVAGSNEDHTLRTWLRGDTQIAMSAVGWAEFLCGPLGDADKSHDKAMVRRLIGLPIPLEEEDAELAAVLFNQGGRRRGSFVDCLVAATAVRAGARLATSNPSDFRRFADVGLALAADETR